MYKRTPVFAWFRSRKINTGCLNFRGIVATFFKGFVVFGYPVCFSKWLYFAQKCMKWGAKAGGASLVMLFIFLLLPFPSLPLLL